MKTSAIRHQSYASLCLFFATTILVMAGCKPDLPQAAVDLLSARELAITGPATIYRNRCSGPYFVNARNADHVPAAVIGNTQVVLGGLMNAQSFIDQNCQVPASSLMLAAKSTTVSFYLLDLTPELLNALSATADGLLQGFLSVLVASPGNLTLTSVDGSDSFGSQTLNTTTSKTYRVQNTGTSSVNALVVTLDQVTPAGSFALVSSGANDCAATSVLAGGDQCNLLVNFKPSVLGAASASLTVTFNDAVIGMAMVQKSLTGTGAAAVPPPPPAPGSIDLTFNGGGQITSVTSGTAWANAVAVQPDGKVVAAGGSNGDFILVRYNANGNLDGGFGANSNGVVVTDLPGHVEDEAFGVAIQGDGKIVVAGTTNGNTFAVARYHGTGSLAGRLDTSFGSSGIYRFTPAPAGGKARAVGIQIVGGEEKIVVGGHNYYDFTAIRLNANGTMDHTFGGGDGVASIGVYSVDQARAMAIAANGKIVLAGPSYEGANVYVGIARFNADGTADTSFNGDGTVVYDLNDGAAYMKTVVVQSDNKIIVGGDANDSFLLLRTLADGNLDSSFGTGGAKRTTLNNRDVHYGKGLGIQADGKIVLAGSARNQTSGRFEAAILRYLPTGSLDSTFSSTGIVTLSASTNLFGNAVALDNNAKKIVVAGQTDTAILAVRFWQ